MGFSVACSAAGDVGAGAPGSLLTLAATSSLLAWAKPRATPSVTIFCGCSADNGAGGVRRDGLIPRNSSAASSCPSDTPLVPISHLNEL